MGFFKKLINNDAIRGTLLAVAGGAIGAIAEGGFNGKAIGAGAAAGLAGYLTRRPNPKDPPKDAPRENIDDL